jgi:hypothetical protein
MTYSQILAFSIVAGMMGLFVWDVCATTWCTLACDFLTPIGQRR